MMRLSSNGTVREAVTAKSLAALLDGTFVLLYGAIVFYVSSRLGFIVLTMVAMEVMVFGFARSRYRTLMSESLEKQAKSQGYLVQLLGGIETLKCGGIEQQAVQRWSNLYVDEINVELKRTVMDTKVDIIRESIASLAPAAPFSWSELFRSCKAR